MGRERWAWIDKRGQGRLGINLSLIDVRYVSGESERDGEAFQTF